MDVRLISCYCFGQMIQFLKVSKLGKARRSCKYATHRAVSSAEGKSWKMSPNNTQQACMTTEYNCQYKNNRYSISEDTPERMR